MTFATPWALLTYGFFVGFTASIVLHFAIWTTRLGKLSEMWKRKGK